MKANKYCYEKQKEFYYDFNFPFVQDMKRYNGFVYKVYSPKEKLFRQVLEHPFNQEVLDMNYAATILREVKSQALPVITKAIDHLAASLKAIKRLSRIPYYCQSEMHQQLAVVEKSQSLLTHYKKDLLKPMLVELQQLLCNKHNIPCADVSSQQLANIGRMMNSTGEVLGNWNNSIRDLIPAQPEKLEYALLIQQVTEDMRSSIRWIQKFSDVNENLILLVEHWKNNRAAHEKQEIFN